MPQVYNIQLTQEASGTSQRDGTCNPNWGWGHAVGDYNGDYSTFRACYPKKQQSLIIQQAVAHIL